MSEALKTKAEQAFLDTFKDVAPTLPGGDKVLSARKAAMATFRDVGLPHRRIEAWKYTDLRNVVDDVLPFVGSAIKDVPSADQVSQALGPFANVDAHLVVFVDGRYSKSLSKVSNVAGLEVGSLADRLESGASDDAALRLDDPENGVLALNSAFAQDGCVIDVLDGARIEKPVLVAHVRNSNSAGWSAARNIIRVGKAAEICVVEAFVGARGAANTGQVNTACNVDVGDGARLHHVKCVRDGDGITHLSNWNVSIGTEATYRGFAFTDGIGLARNEVMATFEGEGAVLNMSGVFLARGHEHVDNTIVVDHKVPGCESRELFKGVLDNRARGVVQGKVIVRPDAQKTDGKQMAQALMLSPDTEFDSKPELEIYADDVVCGHGSTVDDLDSDLMFYCRSRGIPEGQARALLVQSFIGEAVAMVENEPLADALMDMVGQWLEKL